MMCKKSKGAETQKLNSSYHKALAYSDLLILCLEI